MTFSSPVALETVSVDQSKCWFILLEHQGFVIADMVVKCLLRRTTLVTALATFATAVGPTACCADRFFNPFVGIVTQLQINLPVAAIIRVDRGGLGHAGMGDIHQYEQEECPEAQGSCRFHRVNAVPLLMAMAPS